MRRILFTICGRAGSKGFLNKNIRELNGVPLVNYTLAAIQLYQNEHPDDVVIVALNTDSEELKKQVQAQNLVDAVEFVERAKELAGDVVPKVEVVKATYMEEKENYGTFDHVIDLDITSPLRRLQDIEAAIDEMEQHSEYDLVFSVVPSRRSPYFNMVERKPDGTYRKVCESNYTARQQAPKCYELNASIYDYRPAFLESRIEKTILDYKCGIVEMKDYLVLDIDSEEDFELLSYLIRYFYINDTGIINIE